VNEHEEAEFERFLFHAVKEAKKFGYTPTRFIGLINGKGAFQTVKDIVASGKPSEGFDKLALNNRIDLTCEAIIVETRWRIFFDEDLLGIAERRLTKYNYRWKPYTTNEAPNVIYQDNFEPPTDDNREKAMRNINQRPEQVKFRESLIVLYGPRCCITGPTILQALEAAHICAYRGSKSNHPQNGLLLRADLHNLFDNYLFSIEPSSFKIHSSAALQAVNSYQFIHGASLDFGSAKPGPSRRALEVHWKVFNEQPP
jgi:hypothetical protein